jgi:hypothetical protein
MKSRGVPKNASLARKLYKLLLPWIGLKRNKFQSLLQEIRLRIIEVKTTIVNNQNN